MVQEPNSDDVLELARQAEASDLGGGTLEVIDRTVDRFCRDYPTAAPSVLIPRVERLRFLVRASRRQGHSASIVSYWSRWLARHAPSVLAVRPR